MTQARLLGGRYQVGELLGYGSTAEVHHGRDLRHGRDVAIKMLRADLARDDTFQLRFRREAQNTAALNHPAIVAVYDTGEERGPGGESLPYIVMEFIDGRTLKEVLETEGRLMPRRALEITAEICAALEFSHRHSIIHRHIKPSNVMLTQAGQVKVIDFGLARVLSQNNATMTQTSTIIGTVQYLSPEQARGEAADARSDVYATGCVLYELLCGQPPFLGGSVVSVAYRHLREEAKAPSVTNRDVSPAMDAVVLKALMKDPDDRYQSAAEMRSDLLRAVRGQPVLARPLGRSAPAGGSRASRVPADLTSSAAGLRFRRRATRRGYAVSEVDDFLERVEATLAGDPVAHPVTTQDVDDVVFGVRFGGYDESQVDLHLSHVRELLADREGRVETTPPQPGRGPVVSPADPVVPPPRGRAVVPGVQAAAPPPPPRPAVPAPPVSRADPVPAGSSHANRQGPPASPSPESTPLVFLSYRRSDVLHAAYRVYDYLSDHLGDGSVFIDMDDIEPGADFVSVIETAVLQCQVLLAVIGPTWLSGEGDRNGRSRLRNPTDYVRLEIETALNHGITVIPILIDHAEMPRAADLPDSLAPIVRRQAFHVRPATFRNDCQLLAGRLQKLLGRT